MSLDNIRDQIGKYILTDGMSQIVDLGKSHGAWLVDARDGKEYLDLFSMTASMPVGYNHPYVLKNQDRFISSALNKPANSDIYSNEMADFVTTMGRVAQPDYLPYAFYVEGGALAVENALKAAFDWKKRLNLQKGISKEGDKIIYFNQAFHGRSGYTMTLTNTSDPRKTMYYPKFDWFKIDNPFLSFPLNDDILKSVIDNENLVIHNIKNILKENDNDIAALIIEPIQGEGGDNHFRNEFMIQLKELCDSNNMLLIFDEVQTGIGITGKMWAHEHFTVKPDIISFGKKTQVCGMLAGDKLFSVDKNVFEESSRINSTFGGNLVDMYRFKMILEIMDKENLINNAKEMGAYLLNNINHLANEFPGFVTNPRGTGLFCAFDLPSSLERDKFISETFNKKLMILGSGDASIRFRPHLNVTQKDIDTALDIITQTLKKMLN